MYKRLYGSDLCIVGKLGSMKMMYILEDAVAK